MNGSDVDRDRLRTHVERLCAWQRDAGSPGHLASREYVADALEACGWEVERRDFAWVDGAGERAAAGTRFEGVNLVARRPEQTGDSRPRFCVGAHYDAIPNCPGADDNASAVAVLLELARLLPDATAGDLPLEIELVAFDLEEIAILGGAAHARMSREAGVDLRGMVSLEMLGYRDPRPGAQTLPGPLVGQYPDTGDFIAVVGNQNSTALIEGFAAGMRLAPGLPVETLQVPENGKLLQATRLSDHSPFWDEGFPALMITDTSFLRNPHYHTPGDTPESLDYDFLHDVGRGCHRAVRNVLESGLPPGG